MFTKREETVPVSKTAIGLLIALIILIIVGSTILGTWLFMRRRRARRVVGLPLYNEKRTSLTNSPNGSPRKNNKKGSVLVYQEKKNLIDNSDSPPNSPLPEIRITFPEEFDASGKRTSGRVVVVKVGETSVGLEPLDEKLPAYQREDGPRFDSVDLERVGGLTEKQHDKMWS